MKIAAGMLCLLMAAPVVRADALMDLRTALARMTAKQPVRATVALETTSKSDEEDDKPDVGRASFETEHGGEGLRVTYAPEMISRVQQESRANEDDPEKPTPTRSAMRQVNPEDLMEMLDAGAALSRLLARAKVLKDQRVTVSGRPMRQVTLSLEPKLSKSDAKKVKSFTRTLVLNLDADGLPVSGEVHQSLKAKVLLISFQQDQVIGYAFGKSGDRLIAVRRHERSSGSGLGQKFDSSNLMTLALR